MNRNGPPGLLAPAATAIADSRDLIRRWHGTGRQRYAVTPRFAITSTDEQLAEAGALLKEFPTVLMQTHLDENHERDRHRQAAVPERSELHRGLCPLRPARPALAAGPLHPSRRTSEVALMRDTQSVAVFCPTSNLFIGSGLFDYERPRRGGRAHRARDRRRRRHVLFHAAHRRRGLQGDAAAGAKTCRRSRPSI